MIKEEYSNLIFINKINRSGFSEKENQYWNPMENLNDKQNIMEVRNWIKKNFKKSKKQNQILSVELLIKILKKDTKKNYEKGIMLFAIFQEGYKFTNNKSELYFNIEWRDKNLNKVIENFYQYL